MSVSTHVAPKRFRPSQPEVGVMNNTMWSRFGLELGSLESIWYCLELSIMVCLSDLDDFPVLQRHRIPKRLRRPISKRSSTLWNWLYTSTSPFRFFRCNSIRSSAARPSHECNQEYEPGQSLPRHRSLTLEVQSQHAPSWAWERDAAAWLEKNHPTGEVLK
jgi:hypothetical protein